MRRAAIPPRALSILLGLLSLSLLSGCLEESPALDGGTARPDASAVDASRPDGSWALIVIPDSQFAVESWPEIFDSQIRWIAAQAEALHIQFVLHVGDITNNDSADEWGAARASLERLDGVVPYVVTPGNHDYERNAFSRGSMLNAYFPVSLFSGRPSFGGLFEEGRIDNSYHLFETPTGPWLVVALEFGPRDEAVAWAAEIVRAHPTTPAIVVTHAYLYLDETRYDWATRGADQPYNPHSYGIEALPGGVNDGEQMFQAFIEDNDNVDLVVSGHVIPEGVARLESAQSGGGRVHQLLSNYQDLGMGGDGYLRVMRFSPEGTRVEVSTYSPYFDTYLRDAENEFAIEL